jgi:hypothetical protein
VRIIYNYYLTRIFLICGFLSKVKTKHNPYIYILYEIDNHCLMIWIYQSQYQHIYIYIYQLKIYEIILMIYNINNYIQ